MSIFDRLKQSAVDAAATVTGGTLASEEYWSGACRLTLSGSGSMTVTVRGKALSVSSSAHTYTVGDGEAQEGEIWEAANTAHKYKLDNLIVFVDCNNLQLDGTWAQNA